jgi:uncharacterized integral membrane protein
VHEAIKRVRFVIILLLLGFLSLFSVQNVAPVELKFLVWSFESRRIIVIGTSLVIGLAIGWLMGRFQDRS